MLMQKSNENEHTGNPLILLNAFVDVELHVHRVNCNVFSCGRLQQAPVSADLSAASPPRCVTIKLQLEQVKCW